MTECSVRPYAENHKWSAARREVTRRADGCAWPGCPEETGEVNHIIPRAGIDINTEGCHHHQENLEVLCGPHHKRVTKWEIRRLAGLPVFMYPDDGWMPGPTMSVTDVARLLDASPGNARLQTTYWNFPADTRGRRYTMAERRAAGRLRWHTPDVVLWACRRGFLDSWDLHPVLAGYLDEALAVEAAA